MIVSAPSMLSFNEGDGMVQVCAALSALEAIERNFTTTVTTSDGTGNAHKSVDQDEVFYPQLCLALIMLL